MKKLTALTITLSLICSPAHAGWFSKKKKEKVEAAESVQVPAERKPVFKSVDEAPVDWNTLQNAEEVMDALVPRFNANKINNVHPAMTHDQVKKILGDSVLIGYQGVNVKDGSSQSIFLKNPYRAEILQGLGKTYEVLFYITDIKTSDGKIGDDEMTPIIFEGDELIGKDWNFYKKLKKQLNNDEPPADVELGPEAGKTVPVYPISDAD